MIMLMMGLGSLDTRAPLPDSLPVVAPVVADAGGPWGASLRAKAREMEVAPALLYRALTAPERRPATRRQPRYCVADNVSQPGTEQAVCRTYADWLALGLEPVEAAPGKRG